MTARYNNYHREAPRTHALLPIAPQGARRLLTAYCGRKVTSGVKDEDILKAGPVADMAKNFKKLVNKRGCACINCERKLAAIGKRTKEIQVLEPSAAALAEMPEVDLKRAKVRRNKPRGNDLVILYTDQSLMECLRSPDERIRQAAAQAYGQRTAERTLAKIRAEIDQPEQPAPHDPTDDVIDYEERTGKRRLPADLTIDMHLVEYGYQVDVFVDGKHQLTTCRDFSDSYPVPELREKFMFAIGEAISELRSKL